MGLTFSLIPEVNIGCWFDFRVNPFEFENFRMIILQKHHQPERDALWLVVFLEDLESDGYGHFIAIVFHCLLGVFVGNEDAEATLLEHTSGPKGMILPART